MGKRRQQTVISAPMYTSENKSGDAAWGKIATFLGAAASVVALLTWLGISSIKDLKVSAKPHATISASRTPSTNTPNAEPTNSVTAASETEQECLHATDIEMTGVTIMTHGLPTPGSQSADIAARDEMAAEARTSSANLANEADTATNSQVRVDIQNLASDFQALASTLANSSLPTTQQFDQISADEDSLGADCNLALP